MENIPFLQPEDPKRRFIQFSLTFIVGYEVELNNLRDELKTKILRDFLVEISNTLKKIKEERTINYDLNNLQIRRANSIETLLTFSFRAMIYRFSTNEGEATTTIIESFRTQFFGKRSIWKELTKISSLDLSSIAENSQLIFLKHLKDLGLGNYKSCLVEEPLPIETVMTEPAFLQNQSAPLQNENCQNNDNPLDQIFHEVVDNHSVEFPTTNSGNEIFNHHPVNVSATNSDNKIVNNRSDNVRSANLESPPGFTESESSIAARNIKDIMDQDSF